MLGHYTIQSKVEKLEPRFMAEFQYTFQPMYNAFPGLSLPVITNAEPKEIQAFRFGFLSAKNKKSDTGFSFAEAETVIKTKAFQHSIRERRCLVPANCYFEKDRKSGQVYLIYSEETRLFAFGGIWRTWKGPEDHEINTFALISQPANALLNGIGVNRMPLILSERNQQYWLREKPLMDITKIMKEVYPASKMNALPVSQMVLDKEINKPEILTPIGNKVRTSRGIEVFTPGKKPKPEGKDQPFTGGENNNLNQ